MAVLVGEHVELEAVEGRQLALGREACRQLGGVDIGARAALLVARAAGRVVVVPHQVVRLAPRPLVRVGGGIALLRGEGPRRRAVAAATHADDLPLEVDGHQLHLLALVPIGMALRIEGAEADVLILVAVAADARLEEIGIAHADIGLSCFRGHVVEEGRAVVVDPVAGEVPLGLVAGIAGVAVVVEEHKLFGVCLLEAGEEGDVALRAPRDLLIEALALDAHEAAEALLPALVAHPRVRGESLRRAEEEGSRVFVVHHAEPGQLLRHRRRPRGGAAAREQEDPWAKRDSFRHASSL